MKTDNHRRLFEFDNPPHIIYRHHQFLDFESWPNHGWHPIKKKNSENAKIDFQIEDIPKWFFWFLFSIPPETKSVHLVVTSFLLGFGLLAKKGRNPIKGIKKLEILKTIFKQKIFPDSFGGVGIIWTVKTWRLSIAEDYLTTLPPLYRHHQFFFDFDSWPNHSWHPIKKKNSENAKIDFQIEDIPKWFVFEGGIIWTAKEWRLTITEDYLNLTILHTLYIGITSFGIFNPGQTMADTR